ncbi:hypothetical protein V1264_017207 [Littorina saxatilis]|uniref:THAP-type domain-containing protein n=1 Tax=Littorina saxatilis TaxID=31220 RepID=A0AAN9BIN9_9CAEN
MADRVGTDRVRGGGKLCSPFCCKNARYKQSCFGKTFHKFPTEEKRCRIWMQFTRREDFEKLQPADVQAGLKLCTDHFEANQ